MTASCLFTSVRCLHQSNPVDHHHLDYNQRLKWQLRSYTNKPIGEIAHNMANCEHKIYEQDDRQTDRQIHIHTNRTKVVSFGYATRVITLDGTLLEVVPTFVYLGSSISGDTITFSDEVEYRIDKASGVFARLKRCV